MVSIWQAKQFWGGRISGLALVLGLLLALGWLSTPAVLPRAAPFQQETTTPSPSPSPSPSLTPSLSPSPTLTSTLPTATSTIAISPTASLTSTLPIPPALSPTWTFPVPPVLTSTWTFPAPPATIEPEIGPAVTETPVIDQPTPGGPTATLLPLPSVTYQFPLLTPPGELLLLAQPTTAQVLPKGQGPFALRFNPGRGWPLFFLVLLWGGLVTWFVVAQIIARRH